MIDADAIAGAPIAAATRIGPVHLDVADLSRSLAYYEDAIGLVIRERDAETAFLGAGGEDLLVLRERPGASPSRGFSGLFHFALLLPRRADLAAWLDHAVRRQVPLAGASDHFVSEAIYLSDPDEHGIEIYCDRPRRTWVGQVGRRMTTQPLDVPHLLAARRDGEIFERLPHRARIGHIHLRVADVAAAIGFYRDALGFELTAALDGQAAFLGAGGYHHHIGVNSWGSASRGQPPPGSATLTRATILLPDERELERVASRLAAAGADPAEGDGGVLVADPSGNPLQLAVDRLSDYSSPSTGD